MAIDVTYGGSVLGGLVSFLSPCVLPLVPPYLCYMAGVSLGQLTGEDGRRPSPAGGVDRLGRSPSCSASRRSSSRSAPRPRRSGNWSARHLDVLSLRRRRRHHRHGAAFPRRLPRSPSSTARRASSAQPAGGTGRLLRHGPRLRLRLDALHRAGAGGDPGGRRDRGDGRRAAPACSPPIRSASASRSCIAGFFAGPFMRFMRALPRHLGAVEKTMGGLLVVTGVLFITGQIADRLLLAAGDFPGARPDRLSSRIGKAGMHRDLPLLATGRAMSAERTGSTMPKRSAWRSSLPRARGRA